MKYSAIILVFLLILGTGCMSTPVNYTNIEPASATIPFKGFIPAPNYPVRLYVVNENNEWQKIADFTSSDQGSEDKENAGLFWYLWQGEVSIPKAAWKLKSLQSVMQVKAWLIAMYGNTPVEIMKEDLNTCLEENKGAGIATIRTACKSGTSPILTLYAWCTKSDGTVPCEQLYINAYCQAEKDQCLVKREEVPDKYRDYEWRHGCSENYQNCVQNCDLKYSACLDSNLYADDRCEERKAACQQG